MAQPIRDLVLQNPLRSPLFADAPAGMKSTESTICLDALWCPFWSPNRFEYRGWAICRVKSPTNNRGWPLVQAGPAPKPSWWKSLKHSAKPSPRPP